MYRHLTRRECLRLMAASGIVVSPLRHATAMADPTDMPRRAVPGTRELLPVVGLGSTKPVRRIAAEGTGPIESVIRALLRHGGTVVDTAPRPQELDREFGRVLRQTGIGDQLFLAVKINATGKDAGIAQFRQSQDLFGRRSFDLLQIESLTDLETHWPSLKSFRDAGEARYIGVTVAREDLYPALENFMRRERPDFVQLNYSVVEHTAEQVLLPLAQELGIAILVNGPFMNGEYFDLVRGRALPGWSEAFECGSWADFSLRYILGNPAVTCVLTETTNPRHMEQNIQSAFGPFPDDETRARMRALTTEF